MKKNKAIVIGSGFSSLAAACYLAKAGYRVEVLEKNEQIGGRASMLDTGDYRFDMGPSWYWMPDVFERFFDDFNKKTSDYYTLKKLNPAYRVIFGAGDSIDIAGSLEEIVATFEGIEAGSGRYLRKFLTQAEKNYAVAMQDLVYSPGLSLTELISVETIRRVGLFFQNISGQVRRNIRDSRLRSILEFPVLFLGAKPEDTPAFYNFMNYADFGLGTWYPEGGFNAVALGMGRLAEELGVVFHMSDAVEGFDLQGQKVVGVRTQTAYYPADLVVSGADYAHTEDLLKAYRNYPADTWKKKTFAPSSFLYYVGFDIKVEGLLHHNLFFDTDFSLHSREIYENPKLPTSPLFYANFSSKTDAGLCPEGHETGFFLIPVAVDLEDSTEIHDYYFELVMQRLEASTGQNLRPHIRFRKSFGVQDFKERYHSCRGNAYGLANTLRQTSVLRPSIRNKKLKNLFYTGQLTVPGPGVPPALISGKVVTDYILNNL